MAVHFTNNDRHDFDPFEGDEMLEIIGTQRQLSRPTDHYHQPTPVNELNGEDNPYAPPPRHSHSAHNLSRFLRNPLGTTLNQFSRVTNMVLSPTLATFQDDDFISAFNLIRSPSTERAPSPSPSSPRDSRADSIPVIEEPLPEVPLPPPSLPEIPCSVPQFRLPPLTIDEYNTSFKTASRKEVLDRVFKGGLGDNQLRKILYPIILGLSHENKPFAWSSCEELFKIYHSQWNLILADQETRFTAFRERKSLIERDVVRCDRTHAYYRENNENLDKLKRVLLTYTMYDFDTGYVQGMSDLASPLIYIYDNEVGKAFWCFVQVMKLIGHNFEMSQDTIRVQLEMLWKLIQVTDPCFAQFLAARDSCNCYFAFRWIVCQFKREFMKTREDDYDDCLMLWESIWSAANLAELIDKELQKERANREKEASESQNSLPRSKPPSRSPSCERTPPNSARKLSEPFSIPLPEVQINCPKNSPEHHHINGDMNKRPLAKKHSLGVPGKGPNSRSSSITSLPGKCGKTRLTNAELYILSICLSIIRRERDLIMSSHWDATDILKHFNTLQLNADLDSILLHAAHIWHWLKVDHGEALLYKDLDAPQNEAGDDYDLLNEDDYFIINPSHA